MNSEKKKTWQELEQDFLKTKYSCLEEIGGERGYRRIWKDAEKRLRDEGYTITLNQFEQVWGTDFCDLATDFEVHKDRVMAVVHEAAEAEEVKKITGKWMSPRDYYDEMERKGKIEVAPHLIAEKIAPIGHRILQLARERRRI